MEPSKLFKRLVFVTTLTQVVWSVLPWLDRFSSAEVVEALSWSQHGAILPLPSAIFWLSLLLNVAAAIGLCSFSSSARFLFVALTAVDYLWGPLNGVAVDTGLGATLGGLMTLGKGAILALAFTSPLRERFLAQA